MGLAHEKTSYLQKKANLFEIGSRVRTFSLMHTLKSEDKSSREALSISMEARASMLIDNASLEDLSSLFNVCINENVLTLEPISKRLAFFCK